MDCVFLLRTRNRVVPAKMTCGTCPHLGCCAAYVGSPCGNYQPKARNIPEERVQQWNAETKRGVSP